MTHTWNIARGRVLGPAPFLIAGIVNVTPDSFYDGGRHADTDAAVAHALRLVDQGAHLLDIGGESTRPGAEPVAEADEAARVLPVITALGERLAGTDTALCVDTFKAGVAAQALEAGAEVVNDISACRFDPGLLEVVVHYKPGYVLMHSQGTPQDMQRAPAYDDVVGEVMTFFEEQLARLTRAGLPEGNIVLDPGIGFGKTPEHNVSLLRNIDRLTSFGLPVYLGLSNKSVWGAMLSLGLAERTNATVAATVLTFARGAFIHRVHDVAAAHQALTVAAQLTVKG